MFNLLLLIAISINSHVFASELSLVVDEKTCVRNESEEKFYPKIRPKLSLLEINKIYQKEYHKDQRLQERFFLEDKTIFTRRYDFDGNLKRIRVPVKLISSVISHLEEASSKGAFSFLLNEDLGHAHFLLPKKVYTELNRFKRDISLYYEKLFSNDETLFIYHASENLDFSNLETDSDINFRFINRNIVGENNLSSKLSFPTSIRGKKNTVRSIGPHYKYIGTAITLKANKLGCFKYISKDKEEVRFDMSFFNQTIFRR